MELNYIGIIMITVIVIIVGVLIVVSFGQSFKSVIPSEITAVYDKFSSVFLQKSPFNVCQSYDGQKLSIQDFQVLLQSAYNGQCGNIHTDVIMSFDTAPTDLKGIAYRAGIAGNGNLIFYNLSENQSLGIGAIIVQGDSGYYPLKLDDKVEVWYQGQPKGDLYIKVIEEGCDITDNVCHASCANIGICDPACDDGQQHNIPCNMACIDIDGDGVINATDAAARIAAGKCNPDCFSNNTNPAHAYDPGCIYKKITNQNYASEFGGICDPNSNGVSDGLCDPDCAASKNICDPDCNGTVYSPGNPQGINDTKCFVCDGTCNGYCSPACDKNALPGDVGFDPDCYRSLNTSYFCSGDGICDTGRGENCANSADCPKPGITCNSLGGSCCPSASNTDAYGCSNTTGVREGGSCTCGSQCALNLTCDTTSHCCPSDQTWNGTACATVCPQKITNPTNCISSPQGYGWNPITLRYAYNVEPFIEKGFNGTGQNVAIIDWCGDPTIVNDLNSFDQKFGLPAANLNVIGQMGQCSANDNAGWSVETALDVEMVHAMAPGANIYLVVVSDPNSDYDSAVNTANGIPNAIVTMSFGGPQSSAASVNMASGSAKGTTFIAADGDNCAYNRGDASRYAGTGDYSYPAADPNVMAVGGTQNLKVDSNCQYISETAWSCANQGGSYWGTGGNPGDQTEPSYQKGVSAITDGKRGYGDVSLVAGDNIAIYDATIASQNGGSAWLGVDGTSAASPQWAGIIAVLRSSGVASLTGNINPIIYKIGMNPTQYAKAFHDVTSGSNAYNGQGFSAQKGWDYPTGWGSPDLIGLCEVLK